MSDPTTTYDPNDPKFERRKKEFDEILKPISDVVAEKEALHQLFDGVWAVLEVRDDMEDVVELWVDLAHKMMKYAGHMDGCAWDDFEGGPPETDCTCGWRGTRLFCEWGLAIHDGDEDRANEAGQVVSDEIRRLKMTH